MPVVGARFAMPACRVCSQSIAPFISLGRMPVANAFLRREAFADEFFFNLAVAFCPACGMVQLTEQVDRDRLFHPDYAYFSSLSAGMVRHFTSYAEQVLREHASGDDPFIVEIGSNDGIACRHFSAAGVRHLGVDPSENVCAVARAKGVQTLCRFFDEEAGSDIRRDFGPADLIVSANVITHVPDLHTLVRGVCNLLSERGVFVIEEPYLGSIVSNTAYDQFYAEHGYYFSLLALTSLFARHELEVVDLSAQPTHGGSMRYVVARRGQRAVSQAVEDLRARERESGLHQHATYEAFAGRILHSRDALRSLLGELKRANRRVTGYGATAKSTTVTNFCGLGPDDIEYICDTTPGKQGTFSPGMHIPVVAPDGFHARYPDHAVLFAWNHCAEIVAKEQGFRAAGGSFIEYVPSVGLMSWDRDGLAAPSPTGPATRDS